MTANAMQGDREECLAAGMDDYVAKPIDIEELAGALGRCRPLGGLPDASPPEPEVVPESASGPLDPAALERLGAMVGDGAPEFLAELIDTFLDDAPKQLRVLRSAVDRGDAEEARRAAHTLKSTAATFGAGQLSDVCRELESLGNAGALDEAARLVARAETDFARVKEALEAVRDGSRS
jgi:HPt (histidine-containing phosphotransfer) domain-containing protein